MATPHYSQHECNRVFEYVLQKREELQGLPGDMEGLNELAAELNRTRESLRRMLQHRINTGFREVPPPVADALRQILGVQPIPVARVSAQQHRRRQRALRLHQQAREEREDADVGEEQADEAEDTGSVGGVQGEGGVPEEGAPVEEQGEDEVEQGAGEEEEGEEGEEEDIWNDEEDYEVPRNDQGEEDEVENSAERVVLEESGGGGGGRMDEFDVPVGNGEQEAFNNNQRPLAGVLRREARLRRLHLQLQEGNEEARRPTSRRSRSKDRGPRADPRSRERRSRSVRTVFQNRGATHFHNFYN